MLYERIELIAKELKEARPKSMRDLLRDRRDTLLTVLDFLASFDYRRYRYRSQPCSDYFAGHPGGASLKVRKLKT